MCLHAIGLAIHFGWPVPMSSQTQFVSPDGATKIDITISRWFDVFIWPACVVLLFFVFIPVLGWIENNLLKDKPIGPLFKFLSYAHVYLFFFIVISSTFNDGLVWGFFLGTSCFIICGVILSFLAGVAAIIVGVSSLIVALIYYIVNLINLKEPAIIGRFFNYMFANEDAEKENKKKKEGGL
jgi:hypothetical protein